MNFKRVVPAVAGVFLVGFVGAAAVASPWKVKAGKGKGGAEAHVFTMSIGGDGELGAEVQTLSEDLRKFFGAPTDRGVLVGAVAAGSPAEKAGLKVGDVITEVEGKPIDDPFDVAGALDGKKAGSEAKLTVVRDKKSVTLTAKLDKDADEASAFGFAMPGMDMDIGKMIKVGKGFGGGMGKGQGKMHVFVNGGSAGSSGGAYSFGIGDDDDEDGVNAKLQERVEKDEKKIQELEQRLDKIEKKK